MASSCKTFETGHGTEGPRRRRACRPAAYAEVLAKVRMRGLADIKRDRLAQRYRALHGLSTADAAQQQGRVVAGLGAVHHLADGGVEGGLPVVHVPHRANV